MMALANPEGVSSHTSGKGNLSRVREPQRAEERSLNVQGGHISGGLQDTVSERESLAERDAGERWRVAQPSPAEHWSLHVSEKTLRGWGNSHLKGTEGIHGRFMSMYGKNHYNTVK